MHCEKNRNNGDVIYKVAVFSIIVIGIMLRLYWMEHHFTHFDDIGLISCLVSLKEQGEPLIGYQRWGWTYAPFQVFITGLFVNPSFSYKTNLILGRLPSCIAGILSILAMYQLAGQAFKNKKNVKILQLIAILLISVSWENIIYSAQAEPYQIGVLCIILMTLYVIKISREKDFSVWTIIGLSLLALYSQYHIAIFLAAMYTGIFLP